MRVCAAPGCDETFEESTHNQKYHSIRCKMEVKNQNRRRAMVSDVVAAVAPAYMADDEIRSQMDFLRRENQRLANASEKYKNSKSELVEAVYQAVNENLDRLRVDSIPSPTPRRGPGDPEVAVAVLSDFQLGKRTRTYNSKVCAERVEAYADKVIQLTEIQRADHPVDELHVWMLGDIIEGVIIFPGQQWLVDSSFYRQVTIDGPEIVVNFLKKMLANFKRVHVTAVIGNHGRLSSRRGEYDQEDNGDRMLYRIVQQIMAYEPRLTWNIPDGMGEGAWYAVDNIGDRGYLLCHGDQFQGVQSQHGISKKIYGWRAGAIKEDWHEVIVGHWHVPMKLTFNNITFRVNGTTESDNDYAREKLASCGRPNQLLLFAHPRQGITAEYTCWL